MRLSRFWGILRCPLFSSRFTACVLHFLPSRRGLGAIIGANRNTLAGSRTSAASLGRYQPLLIGQNYKVRNARATSGAARERLRFAFGYRIYGTLYRVGLKYRTLPLSEQRRLIIPFKAEVKSYDRLKPAPQSLNREKLLDLTVSAMSRTII